MAYKWLILMCLLPAVTMFLIDTTVVNVALAKLEAVYGVDVSTVQWAVTAYALASGITTPAAAYLEDRFSMKYVWLFAVVSFTTGSVLCGLSPAFWVLIVGRLIQGVAGGFILPVAIGTLFRTFPPSEMGMAMGFFAIPMVAGPALGPTVGGYIVTNLDWRLVFFINVPVGILAALLAVFLMRQDTPGPVPRFDFVGAFLSSGAFALSLYGLSLVGDNGWGDLAVHLFLASGLLLLVVFIVYEATLEDPLLNVRLFAIPQFFVANAVGWVSTLALFGAEFMLPLYLQNLRGLSAVDAGIMLLPQGFSVALVAPLSGRLTDKIGIKWVVVGGFALLAFNTWQMSQITMDTSYTELRWLLVIRGVALGCSFQPTTTAALSVVPPRLSTNASSLNTALRNVFQSFGIALLSSVVQTQTVVHETMLSWQVVPNSQPAAFLTQVTQVFQVARGLSPGLAQEAALTVMLGQIAQQAAVLAFGDAYRVTFFAAIAALVLAFFLPGKGALRRAGGPMAAGH